MKLNSFSANLKELLDSSELTQKEIAEKLNTIQQTISRWLHGTNEPSFDTLMKICYYLDTTPNEILGYDENFEL